MSMEKVEQVLNLWNKCLLFLFEATYICSIVTARRVYFDSQYIAHNMYNLYSIASSQKCAQSTLYL